MPAVDLESGLAVVRGAEHQQGQVCLRHKELEVTLEREKRTKKQPWLDFRS